MNQYWADCQSVTSPPSHFIKASTTYDGIIWYVYSSTQTWHSHVDILLRCNLFLSNLTNGLWIHKRFPDNLWQMILVRQAKLHTHGYRLSRHKLNIPWPMGGSYAPDLKILHKKTNWNKITWEMATGKNKVVHVMWMVYEYQFAWMV